MTTATIDTSDPKQRAADNKLRQQQISWFTTIRPDGRPHSVPVWFLWDGSKVHIFSEPKTVKIRNLHHSSAVTLTLETGDTGGGVVIIDGTAEISDRDTASWLGTIGSAYEAKYRDGLKGLGQSMDQMAAQYNRAIIVTPTRFHIW